ncbi:MAG TPA: hypothetical protein VNZ62_00165 [Capillimicrobium sp.]|nr:hypothetical protein [Capillimicrobium sp.]
MSTASIQLAIDVTVDGREISGHATDGDGRTERFTGWLGLIGVLDALLGSHLDDTDGQGAGR